MKYFYIAFISIFITAFAFSQEIEIKIVELKGAVDLKPRDDEWKTAALDTMVKSGDEIYTGFHSQISLEIGVGSYITINQLTNIRIEKVLVRKEEVTINLQLNNGYLVILSKAAAAFKNKIIVTTKKANLIFDNAGGEVYERNDMGLIVKAFLGKVMVGTRYRKHYFIRKNEMCGMTPAGTILDSDYFLRRGISTVPMSADARRKQEAFYDFVFLPYSTEMSKNDYWQQFHP